MPRRRWRPWLCRPRYPRPVQTAQRPERRTIREFFSWVSFVEIGTIHVVLVHYYDRPGLGDLAPTRRVEIAPVLLLARRLPVRFLPGQAVLLSILVFRHFIAWRNVTLLAATVSQSCNRSRSARRSRPLSKSTR